MASAGIGASVEGLHAADAALKAGRVRRLVVERHRIDRPEYAALRSASVDTELVDDVRPLAETTAPQGIVAYCEPIAPTSLEAAIAVSEPAAVLVFDHIEDPRNLGAAVRSAVAAGIGAIVVPKRRSAPLGATAFKAAVGALESVTISQVGSIPEALHRLKQLGLWGIGLDADGDQSIFALDLLTDPVALVVGSEGSGLSRLAAERCDVLARVPHAGAVESLNASVATALAVFEVARRRGWVS